MPPLNLDILRSRNCIFLQENEIKKLAQMFGASFDYFFTISLRYFLVFFSFTGKTTGSLHTEYPDLYVHAVPQREFSRSTDRVRQEAADRQGGIVTGVFCPGGGQHQTDSPGPIRAESARDKTQRAAQQYNVGVYDVCDHQRRHLSFYTCIIPFIFIFYL